MSSPPLSWTDSEKARLARPAPPIRNQPVASGSGAPRQVVIDGTVFEFDPSGTKLNKVEGQPQSTRLLSFLYLHVSPLPSPRFSTRSIQLAQPRSSSTLAVWPGLRAHKVGQPALCRRGPVPQGSNRRAECRGDGRQEGETRQHDTRPQRSPEGQVSRTVFTSPRLPHLGPS